MSLKSIVYKTLKLEIPEGYGGLSHYSTILDELFELSSYFNVKQDIPILSDRLVLLPVIGRDSDIAEYKDLLTKMQYNVISKSYFNKSKLFLTNYSLATH